MNTTSTKYPGVVRTNVLLRGGPADGQHEVDCWMYNAKMTAISLAIDVLKKKPGAEQMLRRLTLRRRLASRHPELVRQLLKPFHTPGTF